MNEAGSLGELVEAAAYEEVWRRSSPIGSEPAPMRAERFEGILARACSIAPDTRELNGAIGAGANTGDERAAIESALAWLRAQDVGGAFAVVPGTPAERYLRDELELKPTYAWMKFICDLTSELPDPPPSDLAVREVGADGASDFGLTVTEGFGLPAEVGAAVAKLPGEPGWHCMVAYDGDEPAGAGSMFVQDGVAWLGFGATRSEFRRRGAQRSVLSARLALARELGCVAAYTETGERVPDRPAQSYANILRAGFSEQYLRPNFAVPRPG